MSELHILRAARDRISRGWCQFTLAKDANGKCLTRPNSPEAVRWCAVGAVEVGYGEIGFYEAILALQNQLPPEYTLLSAYNNHTDKESVLALFDRAIASLSPTIIAADVQKTESPELEVAEA